MVWTLEEMAERTGIPVDTVKGWTRKEFPVLDFASLQRLAKGVGEDPRDLLALLQADEGEVRDASSDLSPRTRAMLADVAAAEDVPFDAMLEHLLKLKIKSELQGKPPPPPKPADQKPPRK